MDNLISGCNFTLKHYREALVKAKQNYEFSTFKDYGKNKHKPFVIVLRHDIDMNMHHALNTARIEHELGISATYFVRVNAEYNMFYYHNYKIIKELIAMGHEIALHVTEDLGRLFGEDNIDMVARQKAIIEAITGDKCYGFSTHEPVRTGQAISDKDLKKYNISYQAYSPIFTKDMKYISESAGRWYEGCMCNFTSQPKKYPKLCILTHPVWWYDKSPVQNF